MTKDFLPDYSTMPIVGGAVIGLYRLFDTDPWRQVCHPKTRKPIPYPSSGEALRAAKDVVRKMLNPDLRSQSAEAVKPSEDPDILAMDEWRAKKHEEYAAARAMVRNGKNHRKFVIEKKPRRAK